MIWALVGMFDQQCRQPIHDIRTTLAVSEFAPGIADEGFLTGDQVSESWKSFVNRELSARSRQNSLPPAIWGWIRHKLKHGYSFGPVEFYAKHKSTGHVRWLGRLNHLNAHIGPNERLLASHGMKDRELLRILDRFIGTQMETTFSKRSFAYRKRARRAPGARPSDYVRIYSPKIRVPLTYWGALRVFIAAKGKYPFVVKLDLKSFFDTIPHDLLLARLYQLRLDMDALDIVRRYLKSISVLKGCPVGILQGSSVSGTLANAFLHELDLAMERRNIQYLRYADDITLMASTEEALMSAYGEAIDTLAQLDLKVAPEKSKWAYLGSGSPPAEGIDWCSELPLLGFHFDNTNEWWIRSSTLERAAERIRVLTDVHRYRVKQYPLQFAVTRINSYLGYEPRPSDSSDKRKFRIAKPKICAPSGKIRGVWRGWVSCFSRVGYSPVVEMQMHELDRYIIGRLHGMQRLLCGAVLTEKILFGDLGLRSAAGLYRIKAPECT